MKREIVCSRCEPGLRKLFPVESPYPGEHVKFVCGPSLIQCVCDSCGHDIKVAEKVCAFSAWADYGGQPYFEWEDEYVEDVAAELVEALTTAPNTQRDAMPADAFEGDM